MRLRAALLLLTACDGLTGPLKDVVAPPASSTDSGTSDTAAEMPASGLVPVTLLVTRPGADCHTQETLQLPAESWWHYRDGSPHGCNDVTWTAWTDAGDCWEFSGLCGYGDAPDPFITRDAGDPEVDFATCGIHFCPE